MNNLRKRQALSLDKRGKLLDNERGLRSCIAVRILAGHGFEAYNFAGGFRFYDAVMHDRCLIESATACGMDKR